MLDIGISIREQRIRKGIKQKDLAVRCELSATHLSQIEKGIKKPSLDTLERICNTLEIPLPVLSFLSMTPETVDPKKREAFIKIESSIKGMIKDIFFSEESE